MKFSEIRKAVVATAGSVSTLLVALTDTFGALPEGPSKVVAWALVACTGVATYFTRNDVAEIVDRF